MFLFKASGATYRRVVKNSVHAYPDRPIAIKDDEFVLRSKNREDCAMLEKQVQHVAKVLAVREAKESELDDLFPGVSAADRWSTLCDLYWVRQFTNPFHLSGIAGFNARRYPQVQGYAKLDDSDELALLHHLQKTNAAVLLDFLNNAERPDAATSQPALVLTAQVAAAGLVGPSYSTD